MRRLRGQRFLMVRLVKVRKGRISHFSRRNANVSLQEMMFLHILFSRKKARKKWKGNRSGGFHRLGGRRGGKGEEDVLSSPTHQNSYNQGGYVRMGKRGEKTGKRLSGFLKIFDGHNGSAAAIYSKENLLNNVLAAIPSDLNRDEWVAALPRALVAGFVKTDKDFQEKAQTSGTTVTFMIIEGWVLTVASVGDSRCILESAEGEIYYLSADHRLECSVEERERITASGGEVGRLNTGGGTEFTPPMNSKPTNHSIAMVNTFFLCFFNIHMLYVAGRERITASGGEVGRLNTGGGTELSTAGGRLIISSDGVWDALSAEKAFDCCRGMAADAAASQIVKEAVQVKGLRDDTTCIVIDVQPPEKPTPPLPPPKKQVKRVLKSMFRKKPSESSSQIDKEYCEPDVVEEIFEEGSAMLSERLDTKYPICNMFKLFMCAVCLVEMKPGDGISIHAGGSNSGKLRPWDGPFLCSNCQEKKDAMEGKRPSGDGTYSSGSE
ncbi:probable protein phosphatase 2C 12 [Camellia sinensis]|uniref:probable protein phosphatase 2C 12 n=1 Tax=Camellia sinensis TaxID=4442 RepID=UPI00103697B4|nr:probable protein phosphatase 2C 12 [Camellia sinensis]